jgi:YgiT-type zinc finger domain-containing protein
MKNSAPAFRRKGRCPLCGGHLVEGNATIPFVFAETVVLVKQVPAQICRSCHEPFTTSQVTEQLTALVRRVKDLTEVSIISYPATEQVYV